MLPIGEPQSRVVCWSLIIFACGNMPAVFGKLCESSCQCACAGGILSTTAFVICLHYCSLSSSASAVSSCSCDEVQHPAHCARQIDSVGQLHQSAAPVFYWNTFRATCCVLQMLCITAGTSFWAVGNNRTTQGGVIAISGALFAATVGALPPLCAASKRAATLQIGFHFAGSLLTSVLVFPVADVPGEPNSYGAVSRTDCVLHSHHADSACQCATLSSDDAAAV